MNWESVEQAIHAKPVKGESKFHGKMTVFTLLRLLGPVTDQSLRL